MTIVKYMKIFEDIKDRIERCTLLPGDMIPPENRLSKEYNISRTSVRKGLSILKERGYITPVAGKGYFVNKRNNDNYMLCFEKGKYIDKHVDEIVRKGAEVVIVDKKISKRTGLEIGQKAVLVTQVYLSGKKPVAYDIRYFSYEKGEIFLNDESLIIDDRNEESAETSVFIKRKEFNIWACVSDETAEKLLELDHTVSLLAIEWQCFDLKDNPVFWTRMFIAAKYSLVAVSSVKE